MAIGEKGKELEPEPDYLKQPIPDANDALLDLLQKETARSKPSTCRVE